MYLTVKAEKRSPLSRFSFNFNKSVNLIFQIFGYICTVHTHSKMSKIATIFWGKVFFQKKEHSLIYHFTQSLTLVSRSQTIPYRVLIWSPGVKPCYTQSYFGLQEANHFIQSLTLVSRSQTMLHGVLPWSPGVKPCYTESMIL